MQKSFFALVALSVVGLGLVSCDGRNQVTSQVANQVTGQATTQNPNQVTIIGTSDSVMYPMLHRGETIVFQIPQQIDGKPTYVHFDQTKGKHPCDETTITWDAHGNAPQCKVVEDPKKANSFYLYLVDTNPTDTDPMTKNSGKCPTWCPGTLVVAVNGSPTQSGISSAVEVAIYKLSGVPNPAYAKVGQKVTWINPGTDAPGWKVTFDENNVCQEGKTIPSYKGQYCTVMKKKKLNRHNYTITVGADSAKSQLYIIPDPK